MTPIKGSVMLVGGGSLPDSVFDAFLTLAGGPEAKLVFVPTGWDWGNEGQAERAIEIWRKRGFKHVAILHTNFRSEANDPAFVTPLTTATAVWFRGGDQTRLIQIYKRTLVEKELHRLLERGGAVAGSSAGSMVMSRVTITRANDPIPVREGFGILSHVVVDSHFLKRNRIDRLHDVLGEQPGYVGLGVDEGTAAIIEGKRVLIVDAAGVVASRDIKIGIGNWEYTEVLEGLAANDKVITSIDREGVVAGAKVKIETGTSAARK